MARARWLILQEDHLVAASKLSRAGLLAGAQSTKPTFDRDLAAFGDQRPASFGLTPDELIRYQLDAHPRTSELHPMQSHGQSDAKPRTFARHAFSKRALLREDQIEHFRDLTKELCEAWRRSRSEHLTRLPEYRRFLQAAVACGFVCNDFSASGLLAGRADLDVIRRNPAALQSCSLQTVRHVVHVTVRAERWNHDCVDTEVSPIFLGLRDGLLDQVVERLDAILAAEAH